MITSMYLVAGMAHSYSDGKDDHDDDIELDKGNALLYNTLMKEEMSELIELYSRQRKQYPEGPLHVLTMHGDTVLHKAAHTAKADLVIRLLQMLPQDKYCKLTHQNAFGNTVLHQAAALDKLVPAAKEMLKMAPTLLSVHNKFGETALFSAARYGQIEMFKFLHLRVRSDYQNIEISEAERKTFYQNHKGTTVLHTAVILGHFDLALTIANQCQYLIAQPDENGMTALQHFACNSEAFETRNAGSLKHFILHDARVCRVPFGEAIRREMVKYESAKKLASFLVAKDNTSWKATYPLEASNISEKEKNDEEKRNTATCPLEASDISEKEKNDEEKRNKATYPLEASVTPLFLAIKSGCVDIVEMILRLYPQAAEHVDGDECTILHIAVKYRQVWVFDVLHQLGIPWRPLILQRDKKLNTILHMVGQDCLIEPVPGIPYIQLQNEVLLFEHVKEICSSCSVDPSSYRNHEGKTAKEVFVKNNEDLRTKAVEFVKLIIESSSWLSVFIATIAYAAIYTVPGGLDDKTGIPIFHNQPFFLIFIIANVLCVSCLTIALIFFASMLASWYRFKDLKLYVTAMVAAGLTFQFLAVSMLTIAYAATIILTVQKNEEWTTVGFYTIAFLPFTVLLVSLVPLYFFLGRTLFMSNVYVTGVTGPAFPPHGSFPFRSCLARLFYFAKFIIPPPPLSPPNPTPVQESTLSVV